MISVVSKNTWHRDPNRSSLYLTAVKIYELVSETHRLQMITSKFQQVVYSMRSPSYRCVGINSLKLMGSLWSLFFTYHSNTAAITRDPTVAQF